MTSTAIAGHLVGVAIRAVGLANRLLFRGSAHECPLCASRLRAFLPLPARFRTELEIGGRTYTARDFETLAVDDYQCPVCRAADRDRLAALQLRRLHTEGARGVLLHFAPERALSRFVRRLPGWDYRTADLYMPGVDERMDITRMEGYEDGSIACFVCSHVLEHVGGDREAMRELFRILSPGGWGIVMAPILKGLARTSEDPTVTDPAERVRRFGQGDHVRVYAKSDFVGRLEEAGFRVEQLGMASFGPDVFQRAGLDPGSCLYVVRKGGADAGRAAAPGGAR